MIFTSLDFAFFLGGVFCIYWLVLGKSTAHQNILMLASSYFFYASWDYRFLVLLVFSTALDYFGAIKISESTRYKKLWLWSVVGIKLGILCLFKYFNFFTQSITDALEVLGLRADAWTIHLAIPLGISFYTFHGLSYLLDNYKRKIRPEKNFVDYSLFVSFFPLLIAGPIERATTLLPQIKSTRIFNYAKAVDGMRQILWGLFKKIVIADNAAGYVNAAFNNPDSNSGSTLVLGAVLFAFQIYCDFSGYSDIAIGVARLFGIELLRNFAFPYFAKNIKEFWQRWHISLTSWFKDYIYVPMGGSRKGLIKQIRNIFVIFMLSALWHGAGWTFLAWGLLHTTYFMLYVLLAKQPSKLSNPVRPVSKTIGIIFTFAVTTFAWIFFRAENIDKAIDYIEGIASYSLFTVPALPSVNLLVQLVVFLTMEWLGRKSHYAIEDLLPFRRRSLRWSFYYYLISVIYFTSNNTQPFIYFQF